MADDVHDQGQAEQNEPGPDGYQPGCLPRNEIRRYREGDEERYIEHRPCRHVLVQPRHIVDGEEPEDGGQHTPGRLVRAVSGHRDRRDGGTDGERGCRKDVRVAPLVRGVEEAVAQIERAEINQLRHEQRRDRRHAERRERTRRLQAAGVRRARKGYAAAGA